VNSQRDGTNHYAPKFPLGSHTIASLCVSVARHRAEDTFTLLDEPAQAFVRAELHGGPGTTFQAPWIAHIGNNANSVRTLEGIRRSQESGIVVLHDVGLFHLANAWGLSQGTRGLTGDLISRELGSSGIRSLMRMLRGEEVTVERRAELMACIVRSLIPAHHSRVVHSADAAAVLVMSARDEGVWRRLDMPTQFSLSYPLEAPPTSTFDIAISGSGGDLKKVGSVWSAVSMLSRSRTLRVLVAGGICDDVIRHDPTAESNAHVTLVHRVDEHDWARLHRQCSVGLRLGVGAMGECSGVVRDFLCFGMVVVTDEETPSLQGSPRVVTVSRDAAAVEIADAITQALATADVAVQFRPVSFMMGVHEYAQALSEMIGRGEDDSPRAPAG
jgi:hypothetical protein